MFGLRKLFRDWINRYRFSRLDPTLQRMANRLINDLDSLSDPQQDLLIKAKLIASIRVGAAIAMGQCRLDPPPHGDDYSWVPFKLLRPDVREGLFGPDDSPEFLNHQIAGSFTNEIVTEAYRRTILEVAARRMPPRQLPELEKLLNDYIEECRSEAGS